jgi:hypothetical protein
VRQSLHGCLSRFALVIAHFADIMPSNKMAKPFIMVKNCGPDAVWWLPKIMSGNCAIPIPVRILSIM